MDHFFLVCNNSSDQTVVNQTLSKIHLLVTLCAHACSYQPIMWLHFIKSSRCRCFNKSLCTEWSRRENSPAGGNNFLIKKKGSEENRQISWSCQDRIHDLLISQSSELPHPPNNYSLQSWWAKKHFRMCNAAFIVYI